MANISCDSLRKHVVFVLSIAPYGIEDHVCHSVHSDEMPL